MSGTGYRGRTGIYELLVIDDTIRTLVMQQANANTIKTAALQRGMRTLLDDGARKILQGRTTPGKSCASRRRVNKCLSTTIRPWIGAASSPRGIINADSARAARTKLRQSGLSPTELLETQEAEAQQRGRPLRELSLFRRVRPQDITIMIRQLATLLAASLTVVDSLTALIEQTENPSLKKTLTQVRESVNEGVVSAALDQHRRVFSSLFINMVWAGEASGALPIVLLRLADFSEHQLDTRKRITSKMYYPLFMVAIGSLVLLALLTYVVPTVTTVFANMRQTLPWPTVVLIAVSGFYGPSGGCWVSG